MAKQRRGGLGRGISSLMPDNTKTGRLPRVNTENADAVSSPASERNTAREVVEFTEDDLSNSQIVSRETISSTENVTETSTSATSTATQSQTKAPRTKDRILVAEEDEDEVAEETPAESVEKVEEPETKKEETSSEPADNGKKFDVSKLMDTSVAEMPIDIIEPNPDQPRTSFDKAQLEELAKSIKKDGLLQPILVRATEDGKYQIVAGERRWQASKLAGQERVPVRIKDVDDDTALELALIENVQRSDLNPIEEAYGYKRLMDRKKMTQADIAHAMSKGRSTVANALRLLELPEEAQQLLFEEKITSGHARAILSVPSKEGRQTLTKKLVDTKMTVRETEAIARLLSNKPKKGTSRSKVPPEYKSVAKALHEILDADVRVRNANGKHSIEIMFEDEADLKRIFEELIATAS